MLTAQEVRRDIGGARLVGEFEQYCLPQLRFEFRG